MECSHHLSRIPFPLLCTSCGEELHKSVDHAANSNIHICWSVWYYTSPPLSSLNRARFVVPTCWSENQIWLMLKSQPVKPCLCFFWLIFSLRNPWCDHNWNHSTKNWARLIGWTRKLGISDLTGSIQLEDQWPHRFRTGSNQRELLQNVKKKQIALEVESNPQLKCCT